MGAQIVLFIRILIVVSIYGFLGVTLFMLWKLTFSKPKNMASETPALNLINISANSSKTYASPEIYIGRDPNATCQIADESASNLHARIFWKKREWWIEDLNSTNGAFVNNDKLVSPIALYEGDRITCGNTELEIGLVSSSEPAIW